MITIFLTLLFLTQSAQEPKIVVCTIWKVDQSVACPTENGRELITFTDAAEAKEIFNEWRLRAPMQGERVNTDALLYTVEIKEGDKVKAVIEDGKFREIAECDVRVYRNIKHWRMFRQGEIPPNILFSLRPDDCKR